MAALKYFALFTLLLMACSPYEQVETTESKIDKILNHNFSVVNDSVLNVIGSNLLVDSSGAVLLQ